MNVLLEIHIHIAGCIERTSFLLIITAKLACGMCKSLRHRNIKKTTTRKINKFSTWSSKCTHLALRLLDHGAPHVLATVRYPTGNVELYFYLTSL